MEDNPAPGKGAGGGGGGGAGVAGASGALPEVVPWVVFGVQLTVRTRKPSKIARYFDITIDLETMNIVKNMQISRQYQII